MGDCSRDEEPPRPAAARKSSTRSSSSAMSYGRGTNSTGAFQTDLSLVWIKTSARPITLCCHDSQRQHRGVVDVRPEHDRPLWDI